MTTELGYQKGDQCNRNGCVGIIDSRYKDGACSCHIHPPCSFCETSSEFCPECDWDGKEEQDLNNYIQAEKYRKAREKYMQTDQYKDEQRRVKEQEDLWIALCRGEIKSGAIMFRTSGHTHFSMIKEGFYPDTGNHIEDKIKVLEDVKGTFGGRFEHFGGGRFKYIAYTD